MARLSDHDQRDAEDVVRKEIALIAGRYTRRMHEAGKAYTTEAIAEAVRSGKEIDGEAIGRAVAARVRAEYFAPGPPKQTVAITATTPAQAGDDDDDDRYKSSRAAHQARIKASKNSRLRS